MFVTWGILLALTTAALLEVLPLPTLPRLLVTFGILGAVIALASWSQLRCWGTLAAPSFAPSRFAVAIVGASMAILLPDVPDMVGLPVRIALVLVVPIVMVVLLAWDDADTVAKLRERREAQPHCPGTDSGGA